ncbi:MAG TPA: penicillin-binding transpeptidase domain-containing protein [Polyangiaceae bacterium]|nr:penicillin-binding transpeptidase domain-containing protein [Polyangiaceae bacterium]
MRPRLGAWLLLSLGVFTALPQAAADPAAPAPPAAPEPPAVDLRHIRFDGEHAIASAGQHGRAELTLDADLQHAADELLKDAGALAAAVIVVDARTSEVRVFTERGRNGSPGLLLGASAPAASVFKLVTTAALFENTALTPRDEVCTVGGERGVERRHLDAPRGGDIRCAPFSQALGHSRNAVYAQLVTRHLQRSDLIDLAGRVGFNGKIPFDAPVPLGRLSVPYNDLEFARTATGFENSTLSVLGGAYLAGIVANGGLAPRFHIVRQAGDYHAPAAPEFIGRVLSASTARRLSRMMEVTVRGGTAHHAFTDEDGDRFLGALRVAGKTGTLKPAAGGPTTSWFVGFAPVDSPRLIVSVLLQNGTVWRRKAAEVARDLLRYYFAERHVAGVTKPDILGEH